MKKRLILRTSPSSEIRLPLRLAKALLALLLLAAAALTLALVVWISPPPDIALAAYSYICTNDPNPNNTCAGGTLVAFSYCQPTCMIYAPFCVRCGSPDPVCGNGACEAGENYLSCPADCPTVCGNGTCEGPGEWCGSCSQDCGACVPVCGNAWCEPSENCSTCAADCGSCPPVCGNGVCEAGENSSNCPGDCGSPPTTNPDSATTSEDTPVAIDVLANDSDPDNNLNPSSVTVTTPPLNGTTTVDPITGAVTYTPNLNTNGADSFTYQVCDTTSLCATAPVSLTISPVNDPPMAADSTATTNEDTPVTLDTLASVSDPDSNVDPASMTIITSPTNGTATVDPLTGAITYMPNLNYNGPDSLVFQVCDTGGLCDTATVSLTVTPVNDAPTTASDGASTSEDTPVTIDVLANDGDVDGNLDPTSVTIVIPPTNGTASVDPVTGAVTYTPNLNTNGPDLFDYQVCDTGGLCATATVTILVGMVNDAPVAADSAATTNEDTPITIDTLAGVTDPDGNVDPASVVILTPPTNGTATVDPTTGAITYTPAPDYNGADSLFLQVCDTGGLCDTATVSLTITPVADAPVTANDGATTLPDTPVTTDVLANDGDVDGDLDPTSVTIITPPTDGTATVDPVTGAITYTPDPGTSGSDSLVYEVCDSAGLCTQATLTILVQAPVTGPTDPAATNSDPAVSKRGPASGAALGEVVPWSISVSNPSAQPTTPYTFEDPVPAMFDIQDVIITGSATYTLSGQIITFHVGALAPGEEVHIVVNTVANEQAAPGEICNNLRPTQSANSRACTMLYPGQLPATGERAPLPPFVLPSIGLAVIAAAGIGLLWISVRHYRIQRIRLS